MKCKQLFKSMVKNGMKKIPILFAMLSSVFLIGCTQVDTDSMLYKQIKNQTETLSQTTSEEFKESASLRTAQVAYSILDALKAYAPFIIVGSIVLGILIRHLVNKDVAVRKFALSFFIIGVPVITLFVTYGLAFLCGAFM